MGDLGGEIISSEQSMVLDLPPSCIEFCPSHPSYFVVGTYYLEQTADVTNSDLDEGHQRVEDKTAKPQSRNGSLVVFQLQNGRAHAVQTVSQPSAVFDLHFSPHAEHGDVCAAVSSTGTISFFRLCPPGLMGAQEPDEIPKEADILQPLSVLRIDGMGEDTLFTYFSWHPTIPGLMLVTTAGGQVILTQVSTKDYQTLGVLADPILEHSLEAWVAAFSPPPTKPAPEGQQYPCTIFSGGDDSVLKYTTYDPRDSSPSHTPYNPLMIRSHTAGVTSILPLALPLPRDPEAPHIVLTGSYDDHLRVHAIHPPHATYGVRRAAFVAERQLGGGVWRLQPIRYRSLSSDDGHGGGGKDGGEQRSWDWEVIILASCMHAGVRVVRVRGSSTDEIVGELEVLARFEEHASMNYGSDWSRSESRLTGDVEGALGEVLCVSTSFYDRLLCVWKFSL